MPELRWALLILGVVFVAALAWWERRRPHQASRQSPHIGEPRPGGAEGGWGTDQPWTSDPWRSDQEPLVKRPQREPTLTLPEIRSREIPIVEINDEGLADAAAVPLDYDFESGEGLDPLEVPESFNDAPPSREHALTREHEHEPMHEAPRRTDRSIESRSDRDVPPVEVVADDLEDFEEEDEFVVEPEPAAPIAAEFDSTAFAQVEPIVEWPPESERTLISVRLAASGTERFAGRLVRMALAAEGFARGKYDIFHKPDDHNRAVLSAASLTKPGTFDLETIDSQRFIGLSLFAILPGPKAPVKTFEELLLTARSLNERLQGQLQDDRGGPLTPTRVALLRDEVEALER